MVDPKNGSGDIWLVDANSDTVRRFAFEQESEFAPVWSPDGKYLAFAFSRDRELRRKPVQGAEASELLYSSPEMKYPTSWSADGRYLIFNRLSSSTRFDIWVLPLEGDRKPFLFLGTPADETQGQISPDGHWMAYTSNESGVYQVYVESFPASPANRRREQMSTGGGTNAHWRRDGKELYFCDGGLLKAVDVNPGPVFRHGSPRTLAGVSKIFHSSYGYYPAPDGQRFLFSAAIGEEFPAPTAITVVLNRFATMTR